MNAAESQAPQHPMPAYLRFQLLLGAILLAVFLACGGWRVLT